MPLATGTLIFVVALAAPLVIDINTHVGVYLLAAAVGVGNGVMFTLVYASVSAAFPDCPSSACVGLWVYLCTSSCVLFNDVGVPLGVPLYTQLCGV